MTHEPRVSGWVDAQFEDLWAAIERRLDRDAGWAGAIAAYLHGDLIVDVWVSPTYGPDTRQMVYSSTKGVASLCIAYLVERGILDPAHAVAHYWPEFAEAGKQDILVRELLSHQAGLLGVEGGFTLEEYVEHSPLAIRLAREAPAWKPGTRHGYHALTWGTLVDELVRRTTGQALGTFFEREIRAPYDIAFAIGGTGTARADLVTSANGTSFRRDSWKGVELTALNLEKPGFPTLPDMEHMRVIRAAGLPAIGGVGTARGLAAAYAAVATGLGAKPPLISRATLALASTPQATGWDVVLGFPTSFALGFQTPTRQLPLCGRSSFGHDGFAGSLALASPDDGLAFGYLTNVIPEPGGGADPFALQLINMLLQCVRAAPRSVR